MMPCAVLRGHAPHQHGTITCPNSGARLLERDEAARRGTETSAAVARGAVRHGELACGGGRGEGCGRVSERDIRQ